MPLGNYTSQFFANVYLNELDQFVKHQLKAKYYIRYVDDFVILHESKEQLEKWKEEINNFLKEKLKIELHPQKSKVLNLSEGVTFLGFRIYSKNMLIRKSNLGKFKRSLEILKVLYKEDQISRNKVVERLEGWLAFIKHADTFKYRRKLLRSFNKYFPITEEKRLDSSRKSANFLRKLTHSKMDFSVQKTLWLIEKKGMTIPEIAKERGLKEATIWEHLANLVEYGQMPIWEIMPKKRILAILRKIRNNKDKLKEIKERLRINISLNEISCVLAHYRLKDKIKKKK